MCIRDRPMAHVLTGRLMAPVFKKRHVAPEILSRCLEDSGTLAGPMIPWHGYCVYMSGNLGVAWGAFFPFLFLSLIHISSSAPYAFSRFLRSTLMVSGSVKIARYPLAAATAASPIQMCIRDRL